MCLFQIPLIHATVTPLLMPDYPTRMSISATMWLSPSLSQTTCYLQDRDEIADDVIIVKPRNRYEWRKPLNTDDFTHFELLKIGSDSRVESGINAPLTVAS